MKKTSILILILLVSTLTVPMTFATLKITSGEVLYRPGHYLEGDSVPTGYDVYGYNYQGHMFKGSYFNSYAGGYGLPVWEDDDEAYYQRLVDELYFADIVTAEATANAGLGIWWAFPHREVDLTMKWNDAWISNQDRDELGGLDRHWGYASYDGSGAWLTNQQSGTYESDSNTYSWNYFVKIVTPSTAEGFYKSGDYWYSSEDEEVGPVIWGEFAVVQRIYNDQGTGEHGTEYVSEYSTAFSDYM